MVAQTTISVSRPLPPQTVEEERFGLNWLTTYQSPHMAIPNFSCIQHKSDTSVLMFPLLTSQYTSEKLFNVLVL